MSPLAIYIHVPFCTVKCGYCDFNAYAGMNDQKADYAGALKVEIANWGERLPGREVTSISFGGGTPGELPVEYIASVLASVRRAFAVPGDCEVSIEVNPGTTDQNAMRGLLDAGVTRLSIGVQRLDSDELQFLDRIHSPEAAIASVGSALATGFDSVSLDLMYGLPGESLASWENTLRQAITLAPHHISTYALTIEESTPLALRVARGAVIPADPDAVAEMYDVSRAMLSEAGFEHYELSNFAREGHRSRHNSVYWTGKDYVGIGAGAHGFIDGVRYENRAHPVRYLRTVRFLGRAVSAAYQPNDSMRIADWLEARLRLLAGFTAAEFELFAGQAMDELLAEPLAELARAGVLDVTGDCVRLTDRGLQLHSEVTVRFLMHLERVLGPARKLPVEGLPFANEDGAS